MKIWKLFIELNELQDFFFKKTKFHH